jgi:hypothetical protein
MPFIILSGILFAFLRYEPAGDIPFPKDTVTVKGVFTSPSVRTAAGTHMQNFQLEAASDIHPFESENDLTGREVVLFSDREFEPGSECELAIKFTEQGVRLNPGGH